jgi:capsular exopolysaccharide synthesis family protein
MDSPPQPAAFAREHDPDSWRYIVHTKLYRYQALMRKYWWLVLFCACAGLGFGAWKTARQEVIYTSTGRMMVSGKINLPEGATYSEEMGFFIATQRELMQDEAVRQRAEASVRANSPETPITPIELKVTPLPGTSIFVLTATGGEPTFPRKFLDAVMKEFIATRREMRSAKSENAESSIDEEIARMQADLHKEEDRQLAFQRENNVGFLEQGENSAGAYLGKLNAQLSELEREAHLLDLFEVDQKIAHDAQVAAKNSKTIKEGEAASLPGDPRINAPEMEYLQARQQLEVLKTERADYAKDLRPKHPIMVDLDRQIEQQQHLIENFRKQSAEDLQRRREAAKLEIQNLKETIDQTEKKALDLSERLAQYHSIQSEITRKRAQLESLSRSRGNVEINRNVDQEIVSIRQVASPAVAQKPGVGLLTGLLILLVIDQLDDRIASFSEFQTSFRDRVLAQIPRSPRRHKEPIPPLTPGDQRHAFAEAFRSLRSSLVFLPVTGEAPKIFLITSSVPGEGKSTISINLAITLALSGSRVLLVDGDLRRGEIHRVFELPNEGGLTDVLAGELPRFRVTHQTSVPNLSLLPRGRSAMNPGELYLSEATDRFLKAVHGEFDYVVIDSSPVMAADDTTSLAPKVEATIFVFRFTSSSSRVCRKAVQLLRERQANLIGFVCNDVSEAMQEYYYGHYPEYYRAGQGEKAPA